MSHPEITAQARKTSGHNRSHYFEQVTFYRPSETHAAVIMQLDKMILFLLP